MEHRHTIVTRALLVVLALLVMNLPHGIAAETKKDQAAKPKRGTGDVVAGELTTIANQLALNPNTAVDFTHVSGEYCFSAGVGKGGYMSHFATDPTKTQEDVLDFVNAKSLIEIGLNVEKLPRLPRTLGSMTPNQWYFLPVGEYDSHHGRTWSFPMLIKASNVK